MNDRNLKTDVSKDVLDRVPARLASRYCIMPLRLGSDGALQIAVPPDFTRNAKADLKVLLGIEPHFIVLTRPEIQDMISKSYGLGADVVEALAAGATARVEQDSQSIDGEKDSTIITLVNELIGDAIKNRASDIHIEPFEKSLRIRYRVDGILREAKIPETIRHVATHLASRIKIMAKLDIGEKRLPQDGRIKIQHEGTELDLRVSVLPSSFGESIVIRILKSIDLLKLDDLGFDDGEVGTIRHWIQKPHGVILVTGPTGSGKTTTLYSCLQELNDTERKIVTVEDPVEYKLKGLIQMQVNERIDFTFGKALRSILRHDPDCIMIGEIRDAETATIAIRAALTGHLVFSTLHTNDAPSAITRLVEMGVEPYLVASALEGVIAQRLVRRLTPDGFKGRLAVSEMMTINDRIRDLILERRTGSVIRKSAIDGGMISLRENGLKKAGNKLTSKEEIERMIGS